MAQSSIQEMSEQPGQRHALRGQPSAPSFLRRAGTAALWLLLAIMAFRMAFLLGPNADIYCGAALARDLKLGIPLSGWELPPPLFLFPDIVPGVLVRLLTPAGAPVYLAIHAAIATSLAVVLLWFLARRLARSSHVSLAVPVCSIIFLLAVVLPFGSPGFLHPSLIVWPFIHFSSILVGMLLIWCTLVQLREPRKRPRFLLLTGAYLVAVTGDVLTLPQFIAPVLAAVAVLVLRKLLPFRALLAHIGAFVLAYAVFAVCKLIAKELFLIGVPKATPWMPDFSKLPQNIRIAWEVLIPVMRSCWWIPAIAALWLLVCVRTSARSFQPSTKRPVATEELFFAVVGVLILCGTLIAPVLYGSLTSGAHVRYLSPIIILPTLSLGVLLAARRPAPWMVACVGAGVVLASLPAVVVLNLYRWDRPSLYAAGDYTFMREIDDACAKRGVHYGFDSYWFCKTVSVLSENGVCPVAIEPDFSPNKHIVNKRWFTNPDGSFREHESPAYGFVLIGPYSAELTRETTLKRFGEPAAEESLPSGIRVLYYDRPQDLAFRNYVRSPGARLMKTAVAASTVSIPELQQYKWTLREKKPVELAPAHPLGIEFTPAAAGEVLELLCSSDATLKIATFDTSGKQIDNLVSAPVSDDRRFIRLSGVASIARVSIESERPALISYLAIYPDATRYR